MDQMSQNEQLQRSEGNSNVITRCLKDCYNVHRIHRFIDLVVWPFFIVVYSNWRLLLQLIKLKY